MKQITKKQMIAWIGSDNETFDHVLDILHQVVNGKWKVEVLRSDIEKYEDEPVEDFEEYVFSNNVLVKPAPIWKEIRDTFVDEDNIMHIDAWTSEDENDEDGHTIAKIDMTTGQVCYLDERARKDYEADLIIAYNVRTILDELKEDLDKTMDKTRNENF